MKHPALGRTAGTGVKQARRVTWRVVLPAIGVLALWGTPAVAAEWNTNGSPMATAKPVKFKGKITLKFTEYTIKCEDSGTGKAGPFAKGEVTTWTASKCETNQCTHVSLEAQRLPWSTNLVSEGGQIRDILSAGTKLTALKINCEGGTAGNFCEKLPKELMTNTTEGVRSEPLFSEEMGCTTKNPHVEGSQDYTLTEGGKLSVK